MNGWIKIHKKFLEWEWYGDTTMTAVWLHILLSVNWEDTRWQGIEIKKGQCIFGRKAWSKKLNISEQTMRTCITKLKSTSQLTIKSTNKYSVITVLKWDEYQSIEKNQPANQPANQPTTNQQLTTPKEYKNIRYKDESNFSKQKIPDCFLNEDGSIKTLEEIYN